MVEGARLESECWGNSTVGSNPTLSANTNNQATPVMFEGRAALDSEGNMKFGVMAFGLLLAFTARTSAQQPSVGESRGFSGRPDQCLVVSPDGNKFKFRDSWAYEARKKTYKTADLEKIERFGIHVIRLPKDATDADVKVLIAKCQQTILDPVPAILFPSPEQPRFILIFSDAASSSRKLRTERG